MPKVNLTLILLLFFSSILPDKFIYLFSQTNSNTKYSVSMIASEDGFTELQNTFYNKLKTELLKNNLYSETENDMDVLFDIKMIENSDKVALSITLLQKLPKEALNSEIGQRIFYSSIKSDENLNLTENGKKVRNYLGQEYLKQFGMVVENYLETIPLNELDKFIEQFIWKNLESK